MRIVRIVERTGLDAHFARVDRWWSGLSPRERVLVGVLGTLLALAILVYGIIKPLQAERAEAIADIRTFEGLNARLLAAGTIDTTRTLRTGDPQTIVTGSATGFGLSPTVEAVPGGVRARIDDGAYDAVVNWVADVGGNSTLAPTQVQITRRAEPGRVAAQVDFRS